MTFCSRLVVTLGLLGASSRTKPGGFIPVEPVTVNGTASPDSYSLRPDPAPTGAETATGRDRRPTEEGRLGLGR